MAVSLLQYLHTARTSGGLSDRRVIGGSLLLDGIRSMFGHPLGGTYADREQDRQQDLADDRQQDLADDDREQDAPNKT